MPTDLRARLLVLLCALSALAGGCSTEDVKIPDYTGPSEARVFVPVVGPPNPAPQPSTNPAPPPASPDPAAPRPQPQPPTQSCAPTPGAENAQCDRTSASYLDTLEQTIDRIVAEHPDWFDKRTTKCPSCYRILDPDAFVERLAQLMSTGGRCAVYDGEELGVRSSQAESEHYDVVTADLFLRRGDGAYRSTCWPAAF